MAWTTRPSYDDAPREPVPVIRFGPIGYEVTLPNLAANQPLLLIDRPPGMPMPEAKLGAFTLGTVALGAARDPQVGAFIRGSGLLAGTLGEQGQPLVAHPTWAPEAKLGAFVVGQSPLAHRHPEHKQIEVDPGPGHAETEPP